MRHSIAWALMIAVLTVPTRLLADGPAVKTIDDPEAFFELKVRPILAGTCVKCHGAEKASGGLRLDSREAMLKGGETGPAIVPGNVEQSLLAKAIRHDDETLKMPPKKPLATQAQADLSAWIAGGAKWPDAKVATNVIESQKHWAFEPLLTQTPPDDPSGWAVDPIDRWIALGRQNHRLAPVPQADKRALIRRAYFDLTGLPPSRERVASFIADESPEAFAKLVDELLASPRYGERWGRFWLDLARYADTAGDNSDYPIPEAYLYRDYVIDAFNADIPYDRFLHEQLAGDILAREGPAEDYARRVVATGFIAQAKRFGTRKLEDIHQIIEDTLNTTGQVALGLSLRCARCHDHKFDPVTSRDYYALYGFFASTQYPFAGAEEDHKPSEFAALLPPQDIQAREAKHAQAVADRKTQIANAQSANPDAARIKELEQAIAELENDLNNAHLKASVPIDGVLVELNAERSVVKERFAAALKPLRDGLADLEKQTALAGVALAYAVREGKPTDAKLQKGGDPHKQGDLVPRGVIKRLDPKATIEISAGTSGRLELARWLTDGPPKPLTARVMANRIWQHHFGKPIVATPSDFGLRGTPPTHPELLDHLASELIRSGWSIKAMHRKIMLSKTYQLASAYQSSDADSDSGNAWYWRYDRRALDAEALRDSLLALGGNLDLERPGPHPFPPTSKWKFSAHRQFKALYDSKHRSIYLMVQRLQPHPYLSLFNGPDTSMTTAQRDDSTVPLQSLFLVNSDFVYQQAQGFAQSLITAEPDAHNRIDLAFLQAFGRSATQPERTRIVAYLEQYESKLSEEGTPVGPRALEAWSSLARTILASNEFLFVD